MRSALPPGFIAPCLPIASERCKSGPAWVHEIKHDGYRLIARRTDDRVRLYTRRGFNWADRYPRIIDALRSIRARSVTIDGEAVVCGTDGRSDFDKLHSGAHDASVCLYGFDLIELDGEDLRLAPLEQRKGRLEKLLLRSDPPEFFREHLHAHESYFASYGDSFIFRGPIRSADGADNIGTALLIELPNRAAADRFWNEEPFARNGGYQRDVRITRWVFGD